jgi:hypothetical protein
MFITALFTITKLWNQTRCPSMVCGIYTMEFYLAIKRNETMSFAGKWMELEIILLSEISQAYKVPHVFSPICNLRGKIKRT